MEGATPHPRGLGGCAPKTKTRGKLPTLKNPPPSGTQKPWRTLSKRGWAKIGGGGGRAPSQGAVGDVPPKTKIRGKLPTFTNLPPSGTQSVGKPSANGGGQKLGGTRGRWGCPPTKLKLGVSSQSPCNPATSGTQNVGKPSANEGGQKLGVEGAVPPPRGLWGMCPQKQKQGVSCQLLPTCPRVGLKIPANSQQTGVGKNLGVQGGVGVSPHKNKIRG